MSITVNYGSYSFSADTVMIESFATRNIYSSRGTPTDIEKTLTFSGTLVTSTAAASKTKVGDLITAFDEDDKDLVITGMEHFDLPRNSASSFGPQVELSFPLQQGSAHLVTGVPFRVRATARYDIELVGADAYINYQNRITMQGNGGPEWLLVETDSGKPLAQQVATNTPVIIAQQGSATGRNGYPPMATPIYSLTFIDFGLGISQIHPISKAAITSRSAPQRIGSGSSGYTNWGVSWSWRWIADGIVFPPPPQAV